MRLVLYYIENLTSRKMKSIVTWFFNFVKISYKKIEFHITCFFFIKNKLIGFLNKKNINKKLSRMRLVLYYIENLTSRKMKSIVTWFFNFVKILYKKIEFHITCFFFIKNKLIGFLNKKNINKKLSRMRLVLYYIENLTSSKTKSTVTWFFNFEKNII